jgi:hypothetical protein
LLSVGCSDFSTVPVYFVGELALLFPAGVGDAEFHPGPRSALFAVAFAFALIVLLVELHIDTPTNLHCLQNPLVRYASEFLKHVDLERIFQYFSALVALEIQSHAIGAVAPIARRP